MATLAVAVLVIVSALVALLLFARGVAGFFLEPLGFLAALATGLLLSLASWLMRTVAKRVALAAEPRRALVVLAVVAIWLLVVGLTCSHMTSLAVLALWLPVIAMESAWWVLPPEAPLLTLTQERGGPLTSSGTLPREMEIGANVTQQFTRVQQDGGEIVRGIAKIEFAAEEQTAALHLVFSPPLAHDPEVTIQDIAAEGVTVKATDCRSYGVRLEAKRGREASQPLTVRIRYLARG